MSDAATVAQTESWSELRAQRMRAKWAAPILYGVALVAYVACIGFLFWPVTWTMTTLGHMYYLVEWIFPLVVLWLPSKNGRATALALTGLAFVALAQWTIGFGFDGWISPTRLFFVPSVLTIAIAWFKRGAEMHVPTLLWTMVIASAVWIMLELDATRISVRAANQTIAHEDQIGGPGSKTFVSSITFVNQNFAKLDLRNSDVRGAVFDHSDLSSSRVDFRGANLSNAQFLDSPIGGTSSKFENSNLASATFTGRSCEGFNTMSFDGSTAILKDLHFDCAVPPAITAAFLRSPGLDLDGLSIRLQYPIAEYSMQARSINRLEFKNNAVRKFSLNVEKAEGAAFTGSALAGAEFSRSWDVKKEQNFPMSLRNGDFQNAVLTGARFSNVDLTSARFVNADLRGAQFDHCTLTRTNFEGSDLRGANLKECLGTGTSFVGANLGLGTPEATKGVAIIK